MRTYTLTKAGDSSTKLGDIIRKRATTWISSLNSEMELVYFFATLVPLDGMNGVIAQKTNHESQTYALKMEAVYSFEF